MPLHVLVTGGAGFIGTHFCAQALAHGHRVTVVDVRATPGAALSGAARAAQAWTGDVRDGAVLEAAFADRPDVVLHLAGRWDAAWADTDPLTCHAVHVRGALSVLEAARKHGVRHVVFTAGERAVLPDGALAVAEEGAARFAEVHMALHALRVDRVCLPEVYGRGQLANGPVAMAERAASGEGPRPQGPLRLAHVDDVVQLLLRTVEAPYVPGYQEHLLDQVQAPSTDELVTAVGDAFRAGRSGERLPLDGPVRPAGQGHTPGIAAG